MTPTVPIRLRERCTWRWSCNGFRRDAWHREREHPVFRRAHGRRISPGRREIDASVLGVFGAQARGIPVDDVKKFEPALKHQGNKVEILIYPDACQGFERIPITKLANAPMTRLTPGIAAPVSSPQR